MIPILFNKDEKTFTSLGLGQMDATLVDVERERNGNYTLYAEVPFNSPQAKHLTKEMLIKADAGSRTKWQTFKINRAIKDTNADVIKVYADHISMDTINDAMKPKVVITQMTAEGALRQWANNLVSGKAYDVQSDITHVGSTEWTIDEVENARQALGGVSGSILDVWGGEYEFDNNTIILHKEMGRTAPTVLEYGRNIVSLEYEELIDGVYTSIYPYATYTPKSEDNKQLPDIMVTLDELIVDSEYAGNYETRRIQIVDFSNEFDSNAENPEIPTQDKLRTLAKAYVKNNGYGIPKISQEIDFVDLSKTLDYQDIQVMEEIELNDRVPVYYPNIDAESNDVKVTTTNWDVLNNRYSKITLSTIGAMNSNSITSKLSTAIKDLKTEQKKINNTVPYLINAQGNRVWHTTPDDNMEHKLGDTWFKKNGKYTIILKWNGSMWEEVLNDETFITEIEAEVAKAQEEANKAVQSAKDADTKANDALVKAGANANLLTTHQNTLNTINTITLPDIASSAGTALANAKDAMDEAKKADDKIADFVKTNGLVDGTTVESKIDDATGAISRKITAVEGKIPTTIGGRNYALKSNAYYFTTDYKVAEYNLSKIPKGTKIKISIWGALDPGARTFGAYINNGSGLVSDNSQKIELTKLSGLYGQGRSTSLSKWTAEATLNVDASKILIFGLDNDTTTPKRVKYVKVETGGLFTDWTIAPEDNYTQEEFKIFESTYDEDVKGIRSSLTALENDKLDGSTYTTFYKNEYEKTAQGLKDAYEKIGKVVDENGNTTDTFSQAVYDQNATRRTAEFQAVTDDLVTTATYDEGVKGINQSITTVQGKLDNLSVGGRNLIKDSGKEVFISSLSTGYNDSSLTIPLIEGETYTLSFDAKASEALIFTRGLFINTGNDLVDIKPKMTIDKNYSRYTATFVFKDVPYNGNSFHLHLYPSQNGKLYIKNIKLEKGNVATDWSPAPSDMLGKEDFKVFKNDYEETDKEVQRRLTAIDSTKEGSVVTRLNKTESTASGNKTTISNIKTKPGEQITGYQTIKERSDLYERVIGKDENGVKGNISRIVQTSGIIQSEVASAVPNPNLLSGTDFTEGLGDVGVYTRTPTLSEASFFPYGKVATINTPETSGTANIGFTVRIPKKDTWYTLSFYGLANWVGSKGVSFYCGYMKGSKNYKAPKIAGSSPLRHKIQITVQVTQDDALLYVRPQGNAFGAYSNLVFYGVKLELGEIATPWENSDPASSSKITQLADNINLKVSKGDLISQINVQAGSVLIQSGTNKLNVTPTTTYIEDSTIKSAMIESLEADKIKTGTLDAGKVKVINIDAENITSNKTSFVQSAWNGINNTVSVNASGIRSANSKGDWTLYHSGAVSFGNSSSQGIYLEYADGTRNGLAINNRGALNTDITLDLVSSARNTMNFGRRTDTNGYDFRIDHYQGTKVSFDGRGVSRYTFNVNSDTQSHAISILGHGATSGYNSGSGLSIGMETADGKSKGSRFYFSSTSDLVWLGKNSYSDLKPLAVFDIQFRWGQNGRKSMKDVLEYLSRASGVDINNIPYV